MVEEVKKEKPVKKEPVEVVMLPTDLLERMGSAIPEGLQAKVARQKVEHESNYIDHDDQVAVFDFTTRALSESDAVPGHYMIVSGPDVVNHPELEELGITTEVLFTKQKLRKTHRWRTVINFLPSPRWTYEVTICSKKSWDEFASKKQTGALLPNEQQAAAFMLRAGGAV